MKKRTMSKRCIAWVLTLVMVLNVVNLPAFTLGVKATGTKSTIEKAAGDSIEGETSTEAGSTEAGSTEKTTEAATTEEPTEEQYTVNFTDEDGTTPLKDENGTDISAQTVEKNGKVTKPSDPVKTGYKFLGWYKDGENTSFDFTNTQITAALTLKAKWEKESYTIEYKGLEGATFDGSATNPNPMTYTIEDNDITLKNPAKKGYIFTGWADSAGKDLGKEVKIAKGSTGKKSYTAKWEKESYTIEYKGLEGATFDGSATNPNPTTYTIEDNDITLKNPAKKGYTFAGWADSAGTNLGKEVKITKGSTGKKSYTAKWEKESYTIEYKGLEGATFDGSATNPNPTTYTIEDNDITLKNPTKKGYTFLGWTEDSEEGEPNQNVIIKKGSTGNKTYWAHWKQNEIEVTVTGTYVYNEEPKQAEITVKDKETGETLKETEDYKVTYENNTDAGTATVTVTGKGSYEGKTGSGTFEIKKGKIEPKYAPVTAYCGQKLSDVVVQPDGVKGSFQWKYTDKYKKDTVMSEGAECTITATFEPENKNYESKDVTIVVKPVHDFGKLTNLEHQGAKAVDNKKKKAGSREYYHCKACGKYYDENKKEQSQEYFIVPYVEKSITVTLGSGNTSISKYVKDGKEAVVSQVMKSPSTYKKYLTFDAKKGTIKTPKSKKYYKKKIKNPTIVVTDKAGEQYPVKVKLQITKPTVKVSKKSYTSGGVKGYKYTIKCSASQADKIFITATSGLANKKTKKKLNNLLKSRNKQIKVTKKKASGTISFTIAKRVMSKKLKLSFQVYAKYGANKSAVREISK